MINIVKREKPIKKFNYFFDFKIKFYIHGKIYKNYFSTYEKGLEKKQKENNKNEEKNMNCIDIVEKENKNNLQQTCYNKKYISSKEKKLVYLENTKKNTMYKLNIQIDEANYEDLLKYKNIKNVILMQNKKNILKYLNSYILNNNKAKYYILRVLMFTIIRKINEYKINELIYILHTFKEKNFLNPFIILYVSNKISTNEKLIKNISINEFVFLLDILNIPLLITNKFIEFVQNFINQNVDKFSFTDFFIIAYFLAKNNLHNEYIFNTIAYFYEHFGSYLFSKVLQGKTFLVNSYHICDNDENLNEKIICEEKEKWKKALKGVSANFFKETPKHLFIFSKYGYRNVWIYKNIYKIITLKCYFFKPSEISSILKSAKNINLFNSFLFKKLTECITQNLSQYKICVLLDCLNSLSFFNYKDNKLITKILVTLPRTIQNYTSNDFVKLVFFLNNFIIFSKYFIIFFNQQILYFSSSLGINHLIKLLNFSIHQNFISTPIFYLLNIKLTSFISHTKVTTPSYENNIKQLSFIHDKKSHTIYKDNTKKYINGINLKNILDIFHLTFFISLFSSDLFHKSLECVFMMHNKFEQLSSEKLKDITHICSYFILIHKDYDHFCKHNLYLNIRSFFDSIYSELFRKINDAQNTNDHLLYHDKPSITENYENNYSYNKDKLIAFLRVINNINEIKVMYNNKYVICKHKLNETIHYINILETIIITFLFELMYQHLTKKKINKYIYIYFYNFCIKYIKCLFFNKNNIIPSYTETNSHCLFLVKKLLPIIYSLDFKKYIKPNSYLISTYALRPFQNEDSDLLKSCHKKREIVYHYQIIKEMYELLKSLKHNNYKFKFINKKHGERNSIFLYTDYIYVKNIKTQKKIAILFAAQNYYYTPVDELKISFNSFGNPKFFEKKSLTKLAQIQLEYFNVFFSAVHLVPFYLWKKMTLDEKKKYFLTFLEYDNDKPIS
ncbi:conserved Plasmodium protein, unknown function [Plasmodium berghei]|uniref:Uncharacterized protein n=2 Tax=Plasmodium berghei TaxID=5821 RepID=A0A509AI53_PLABA|nr:conserved Plasmodium protein, unknown function [Plasmodium berghei ANKA]CXI25032.1 conserved Plasmodium protein, unknown function [Plasmodium berghei]SCM20344.1 conserved Plasmodium protein, unknown function [Plasmodium berghei]SCN23946.1 conserved Plasmodium protein, unknown function [Plasmodium berghei]SCO59322.1 conserved Plasmodium protein, unknown function [Plasmodium berghei]SCO60389.1 conserved Plasmodium protein, unknown function [Plasmodium berghei]|eukprot:XP_034420860.1 conserved Plasmodium protein, unknown function [Plasmodium berghei ANKA]